MCEQLTDLRSATAAFASGFDPHGVSVTTAARVLRDATAMKHMWAAVEAQAATRVAEGSDWKREGYRSPADKLAADTGTSVGAAIETLKTAERLQDCPAVADAARRGELSPQQTAAVASAASVAPQAEQRLLEQAGRLSLKELQAECGSVRAGAMNREALRAKHRRERFVRHWTDAEGAGHIHVKGAADDIAAMAAGIDAERDRVFNTARDEGRHEPTEAYAFDALQRLCTGEAGAASVDHKVIVRIDLDVIFRGWPTEGETCEVAGVPVAASAVEDIIARGGFLAAVITKAEQIVGVAHVGRAPTARQQTALEWLYPTCAAEGCSQSARLQRDHRIDWAKTKVTVLEYLDLLCPHHHGFKTTKGWGLVEGRGKRAFVPPDDPRHPQHAPPDAA